MHGGSPGVSEKGLDVKGVVAEVESEGKEGDLSFVSGDVSASEEEEELGEEENGAAASGVPVLNLSKVSASGQATTRNGRNGRIGGGDRNNDSSVDDESVQAGSG